MSTRATRLAADVEAQQPHSHINLVGPGCDGDLFCVSSRKRSEQWQLLPVLSVPLNNDTLSKWLKTAKLADMTCGRWRAKTL
ncbi:hypothetical protein [Nocardia iowensis]|uniref:Uncharacterized protein n=1 Tax=Nocardia iowensis TaxID=204891 RepID=A0ABX8S0H8_NOCIO|nr:hypothetical protein [Nocardia iowensis]QXN94607.1 hypothetical protein KV110_17070 [Nocardia iowensis]